MNVNLVLYPLDNFPTATIPNDAKESLAKIFDQYYAQGLPALTQLDGDRVTIMKTTPEGEWKVLPQNENLLACYSGSDIHHNLASYLLSPKNIFHNIPRNLIHHHFQRSHTLTSEKCLFLANAVELGSERVYLNNKIISRYNRCSEASWTSLIAINYLGYGEYKPNHAEALRLLEAKSDKTANDYSYMADIHLSGEDRTLFDMHKGVEACYNVLKGCQEHPFVRCMLAWVFSFDSYAFHARPTVTIEHIMKALPHLKDDETFPKKQFYLKAAFENLDHEYQNEVLAAADPTLHRFFLDPEDLIEEKDPFLLAQRYKKIPKKQEEIYPLYKTAAKSAKVRKIMEKYAQENVDGRALFYSLILNEHNEKHYPLPKTFSKMLTPPGFERCDVTCGHLKQCLEFTPNHPAVLEALGHQFLHSNKSQAEFYYRRALQSEPTAKRFNTWVDKCKEEIKDHDLLFWYKISINEKTNDVSIKRITDTTKIEALAHQHNNARGYAYLGGHFSSGAHINLDPVKAIYYYKKALELKPNNYKKNLGANLLEQNQELGYAHYLLRDSNKVKAIEEQFEAFPEQGIAAWNEHLANHPKDAYALAHLGYLHLKNKDREAAEKCFKQALAVPYGDSIDFLLKEEAIPAQSMCNAWEPLAMAGYAAIQVLNKKITPLAVTLLEAGKNQDTIYVEKYLEKIPKQDITFYQKLPESPFAHYWMWDHEPVEEHYPFIGRSSFYSLKVIKNCRVGMALARHVQDPEVKKLICNFVDWGYFPDYLLQKGYSRPNEIELLHANPINAIEKNSAAKFYFAQKTHLQTVLEHNLDGLEDYFLENFDEFGEKECLKALEKDPKNDNCHHILGEGYLARKDYDAAMKHLDHVAYTYSAQIKLAKCFIAKKDYSKALHYAMGDGSHEEKERNSLIDKAFKNMGNQAVIERLRTSREKHSDSGKISFYLALYLEKEGGSSAETQKLYGHATEKGYPTLTQLLKMKMKMK